MCDIRLRVRFCKHLCDILTINTIFIFALQLINQLIFVQHQNLLTVSILFLFSLVLQLLIAERQWYKRFIHFIVRKKGPRNKFKCIEMNLQANTITQLHQQFQNQINHEHSPNYNASLWQKPMFHLQVVQQHKLVTHFFFYAQFL